MTSVMPGLLPASQGIQFTARPALRTRDSLTSSQSHTKPARTSPALGSKLQRPSSAVDPNAKLSSIEVEALLREKVRSKFTALQQAFQTYDVDQVLSVTKGEFRRAIETFCMPLSTDQFETVLAKVDKNNNGTVKYCDFLDKFNGKRESSSRSDSWLNNGKNRLNPTTPPGDVNTDMVEKMLKQKISKNLKQVVKALRLFDYNRDGKIQRHEMRRVLENFCFRFTDPQFDKLWQRYDYQHAGVLEYMGFLRRLGVLVDKELSPGDQTRNMLSWNTSEERRGDDLNRKVILQSNLVNKGLNFDQIELEFRKLMRKNYLGIKKACMARDSHLDGWLKIDDLKAILDQFTVHMSDQLFAQLMDRFQIKASGTVKWEFFLSKFQDPQSFGNGQTIPIKPNHKWFPLRGGDAGIPMGDVWTLLYKHVHDHHPTLKQAFLQYDKNRNGTVSRKELREVFDKMNFRLSEDQFKKLLTYIDPEQTNRISYHAFLDLFEEKETLAGHKWLNSCHRVNDTKPTLVAWKTVEDVLREKIREYWKPFSDAIVKHDTEGNSLIAPKFLKRALDRHVLPVTDEHFEHLLSRVSEQTDGKVNYVEFLEMLDVVVTPGDLVGLSTQITDGNVLSENMRKEDLQERIDQLAKNLSDKSGFLSADEVIYKLKDRMSQHNVQIRKSFLYFAGSNRARISKKNFREMLASLDMFLTDDQFKQLTAKLNFQSKFMNYMDFVASFDDPSGVGPHQDIVRTGNHRVNPIRGDEYGMTALEAESKLRGKLRENFADLRGAFYKFDDDHNGLLTKENFRRLLDTFMVLISDEEFEKLCVRLGLHKRSRISYQDFLDRFEVRDTAEGHKWLNSVHRFNDVKTAQPLTAEQVHHMLQEKSHRQWHDLAKAFLSLDRDGNGVITKKELRHVLSRFTLPLSREEFSTLWAMYDTEGKGYVNHADFLEKIGATQYAPGDQQGVSKMILLQNHQALDDHIRDQQAKQEQITLNQAQHSAEMSAEEVHRILKDKIRDNYSHYYTAFKKYDTRKRGCLSVRDVQQVLIDLNYFITEQEFFRLLDILGLATRNSKLNYEDFLRAFEDGRKSSYGQREVDVNIVQFENLNPEEAELKLLDRVAAEFHMLKKAMTAFDKQQTGKIPTSDFRRLLDLFCFRMTDSQFRFLLNRLYTGTDNCINYRTFLDQYHVDENEDTDKWLQQGDDSVGTNLQPLTLDEVTAQLREAVSAHFYVLAKEFADLDYAKIGVIGRDDFRELLDKHIIRLSDTQFEEIWSTLPVNEFGNIDYREFLKEYSNEAPNDTTSVPLVRQSSPVKPFTPIKRPRSTLSRTHSLTRTSMVRPMTMMSRAASRTGTPLVNAASVEQQLTQQICRHWKDIQRQCRERDPDNTGTVSAYDFRDILTSLGVDVRGDDFHKLALKYELQESGRFSYVEFLRHFMLTLKPTEGSSLLLRPRITPPNILKIEEENCNNSYQPANEAASRLQIGVRRHWKDMRRSFRKIDSSGSGLVNPLDFRHILKQHSVDLSEEEFYEILSRFDKSMDGSVNYNAFIKAYLL